MRVVVNFCLTLALVGVFTVPVAVNFFVVLNSQGGVVAGANSITERDINVIPNLNDFDGHVRFDPSPIEDGKYEDVLQLRVFQRQKASYRGLYTIYNLSENRSFRVEAVTPGVATENLAKYESIRILLDKNDQHDELLQSVGRGNTLLKVGNVGFYHDDQSVFVGDELVKVVVVTEDGVIVTPLQFDHPVGEFVYPESIFLNQGRLVNPQTEDLVIKPGEKILVDAVVQGTADLMASDDLIELPLKIKFVAVE